MPKVTTRNQGKRANDTRYPLRGRSDGTGGAPPSYVEAREYGIWSGGRPSFTFATWNHMLKSVPKKNGPYGKTYQCPDCKGYFHRKKDLSHANQSLLGYISIDHTTPFDFYIRDNAAPNDDGRISSASAAQTYNDINNLEIMCNKCNSSKNGSSVG